MISLLRFMGFTALVALGALLVVVFLFNVPEIIKWIAAPFRMHSQFNERADIKMKAKVIKKLYIVNKQRWSFQLTDSMFYFLQFTTDDKCCYDIGLSFVDHLRLLHFFKTLSKKEATRANLAKIEKVIATTRRDIAKEQETATQHLEQAQNILLNIPWNDLSERR